MWDQLIRYTYVKNYPFQVKELSLNFLDIRDLFVILSKIVKQRRSGYSLDLDSYTISNIQNELNALSKGGLGIKLKEVLKKLSEKKYRKGGQNYNMFQYKDPKPYHTICGKSLPQEIKRVCFKCHALIIPQKIRSKEEYETKYKTGYKEVLECPKCGNRFTKNDINCPSCNPRDLPQDIFRKIYPNSNPNSAYIFPDKKEHLSWSDSRIIFDKTFFNSILKGIELEQKIYHQLIDKGIPPTQILVSTLVETPANAGYGTEIDILFIDNLVGKINENYQKRILWAIEIKNWKQEVDKNTVLKFYNEVSPITPHLMFISPKGYENDVFREGLQHKIRLLFWSIRDEFR